MGLVAALESVRKASEDIYVVDFPDGTEVIFKLPSYKQASQYAQMIQIAEGNHALECIIYDHMFQEFVEDKYLAIHDENLKAGIPETIAKLILYLSGTTNEFKEYTETLLNAFRQSTNSILAVMRRTICRAFSAYKISDIEAMSFQEMVRVYVDAEKTLMEQGIIEEELRFAEPEEHKPFRVEDTISQDSKEYQKFDSPDGGTPTRMTDDPAYKAKMEEFRIKQRMSHKP